MPAQKATVDFQIKDDGTAKAVASAVDKFGEATTLPVGVSAPVWSVADSGGNPSTVLTLTADAGDASGLTQDIAVNLPSPPPSPLPTGLVVSVSVTLADGTTKISGSGTPIDIVPGTATAFTIVEQ